MWLKMDPLIIQKKPAITFWQHFLFVPSIVKQRKLLCSAIMNFRARRINVIIKGLVCDYEESDWKAADYENSSHYDAHRKPKVFCTCTTARAWMCRDVKGTKEAPLSAMLELCLGMEKCIKMHPKCCSQTVKELDAKGGLRTFSLPDIVDAENKKKSAWKENFFFIRLENEEENGINKYVH